MFSCMCYDRIHGISEDKRGVLELCPQYLPGRTYYIYGFGRYALYPKKNREDASCSRQCLIASLDGHMVFIDADLIAAIKFFNEMSPIELGYFDQRSITRDFTNVPCLSKDSQEYPVALNLVKSVFTPVPAPKLPDGFLRWYGNCTLRLNGDEALLRHRPLPPTGEIVITEPIRYNNKSKKTRTTSELTTNPSAMQFFQLFNPNPAVPPILGIPSQEGFPRRYNLPSMLVPTTRSTFGSTTTYFVPLPATAPPQESSMWQRSHSMNAFFPSEPGSTGYASELDSGSIFSEYSPSPLQDDSLVDLETQQQHPSTSVESVGFTRAQDDVLGNSSQSVEEFSMNNDGESNTEDTEINSLLNTR